MMEDELREGLVPAYTELLKDERFQELLGALATMYGVVNRKVTSIDQRSFKAAKERLTAFVARTSGWNAKLSRDTRNGSWNRGAVHPPRSEPGRSEDGDLVSLGRRGGRVRSGSASLYAASEETPDSPAGAPPKAVQRPGLKTNCPTCQAPAQKVWRVPGRGLVCPHCVRAVSKGGKT